MSINRKIWLNCSLKKPCPNCSSGTLSIPQNGNILKTETQDSKIKNSYNSQWYSDYIFSIHLICDNCSEIVCVTGFSSEEDYPSDEEIGLQKTISKISFFPALKIIHIPNSCPKEVKKVLNDTFSLFWLDLSSCANKIRISIELLLNELNIPNKEIAKNGEKELTLHSRLILYEKINPEVSKFLIAIKWIGNAGSHYIEVKKEDVLDAYELLEYALEKLYNERELNLIRLSEEINIKKKPIK